MTNEMSKSQQKRIAIQSEQAPSKNQLATYLEHCANLADKRLDGVAYVSVGKLREVVQLLRATGEPSSARRFTGVGHLEETGYIPAGSAAERERAAQPPGVLPEQAEVLAWAVRSFGPIAQNIDERAARVAEEAIEIAQVEGVPLQTIKRIAERVYSRPPGERWQEIGGTMIGILSYAEIVGLSMAECARREFDRVMSKPREWWQKKHAEKVEAGTANLSPCSTATKGESHG